MVLIILLPEAVFVLALSALLKSCAADSFQWQSPCNGPEEVVKTTIKLADARKMEELIMSAPAQSIYAAISINGLFPESWHLLTRPAVLNLKIEHRA